MKRILSKLIGFPQWYNQLTLLLYVAVVCTR